tara:strand:- start:1750 stop:1959 length:210 start_codon:yes stop_codon:yes gene_type:complete
LFISIVLSRQVGIQLISESLNTSLFGLNMLDKIINTERPVGRIVIILTIPFTTASTRRSVDISIAVPEG